MDLHIIRGGIGKSIAFTSILDKLTEKICVAAYWENIFKNVPNIEAIYPSYEWNNYGLNTFYQMFDNIFHREIYFGNFLKGNKHLIEIYHEEFNLPFSSLYHNVEISEEKLYYYSKFIEELGDFVLVQFIGSDLDRGIKLEELGQFGSRSLRKETSQEIINILSKDLGKKVIEVNNGKCNFDNTFVPRRLPEYFEYLVMTRYCQSFISIDSCLNHMSAFKNDPKKGVCLWRDREYGKLFEYPHNTNLYSELPLQMKFNAQSVVDELMIAMDFNKNQ